MEGNTVRAYNQLYDLGFTEEQIKTAETEAKNNSHSGLYIITPSKMITETIKNTTKEYYLMVDHDNKDRLKIQIKELAWKPEKLPCRVLCKTEITFEPPDQVYRLHEIISYRAEDTKPKTKAENIEQLKQAMLTRLTDKYTKYIETGEQRKAVFWLVEQEDKPLPQKTREGFKTITHTFQTHNRRTTLQSCDKRWNTRNMFSGGEREHDQKSIQVQSYHPNQPEYNYASPGREIYKDFDTDTQELWLDDELIGKIGRKEAERILKEFDDEEFILLTKTRYAEMQNRIKIELISIRQKDKKQKAVKQVKTQREKDFEQGKAVTINNITYTKKDIAYNGMKLTISGGEDKYDSYHPVRSLGEKTITRFIKKHNLITSENEDFNGITEQFIYYALDYHAWQNTNNTLKIEIGFTKQVKLTIGHNDLTISKINNNYFFTLYEKDYRIRKEEMMPVLKKALALEPKTYAQYLEQASKIGTELIKILREGLSIRLEPTRTSQSDMDLPTKQQDIIIHLNLKREKNNQYLIIDNNKYKVTDTPKLLTITRPLHTSSWREVDENSITRFIRILTTTVKDIPSEDINKLITNGVVQAETRITKSEEFVMNAIELSKAEVTKEGVIVKGESGNYYLIIPNNLHVYTYDYPNKKQDKYLCLIDMDTDVDDKAGRNDALAKRILAMSKDKTVADDIYKSGDKVDSYWRDET